LEERGKKKIIILVNIKQYRDKIKRNIAIKSEPEEDAPVPDFTYQRYIGTSLSVSLSYIIPTFKNPISNKGNSNSFTM
jgi:hypothetical protein